MSSPALADRPHALYRMYGVGRDLLYIGITLDVESRSESGDE